MVEVDVGFDEGLKSLTFQAIVDDIEVVFAPKKFVALIDVCMYQLFQHLSCHKVLDTFLDEIVVDGLFIG